MHALYRVLLAIAISMAIITTKADTDFSVTNTENYSWNQSDWSLTTTKPNPGQFQSRMSLANGYIGTSLAALGPFFEQDINQTDPTAPPPTNGWPLFNSRISFSTIAGFYNIQPNASGTNYPWLNQYGWESFGAGIPHLTSILFTFGGETYDANATLSNNATVSNFRSEISFKKGIGEWWVTWTPASGNVSLDIHYTVIFSRQRPNVAAVAAEITPSDDISGTVTDLLDGRSAVRSYLNAKGMDASKGTIYTSVHPSGLANITAFIVSGLNASNTYTDLSSRAQSGCDPSDSNMTIGQTYNINLKKGETAQFYKFIGVASTDKFRDAESTARDAQKCAQEDGFEALKTEHIAAWAEILTEDNVDDFRDPSTGNLPDNEYVTLLQISAAAHTYYLIQNTQPDGSGLNDDSIPVGGLVSDSYGSMIFWDADYWMAPGLNIAFPKFSKQILNFPLKQFPQALKNAAFNNFPNGSALYSWTSGRYGNCTGTGPCVDYEYHKNFDIAFNVLQYYSITNNETWFNDAPIQLLDGVAKAGSYLLQYNETTETFWIHNMTDPDEYANNKDNGAFTIASDAKLLQVVNNLAVAQGLPLNNTWDTQSKNIQFPRAESGITLEYQTMNNSVSVKQADVALLSYPLGYSQNYTPASQLLDLDYYANKQSPDGPGMTYGIFAIDSNSRSQSGSSAFVYTLDSGIPYLRAPFFQMSEQADDNFNTNGGTNPAFPFLTGHGGANQVVPFGWLGLRTDQPVLFINPSLPPQIPFVKVRTFHFAGSTFSSRMNTTHTIITRLATPASSGLKDKYANSTAPFRVGAPDADSTLYQIAINQTVTIPNRLYWQNLTYPNNLLQNLPATSFDAYVPGQFPVAAVDGATSTRWQPATNETASLIVNMTTVASSPITGLYGDFGTRPPRSWYAYLSNTTEGLTTASTRTLVFGGDVTPSLPFNASLSISAIEEVTPVVGNTTIFNLTAPIWSGNYAMLVIEGCWEEDGVGATVGEFVLVTGS